MQKNTLLYKSLWLLLICTTLIACSTSSQEIPSNEEELTAIGFNAKVQDSRAGTNEELSALKENGFKVWGGYDQSEVFGVDGTQVGFDDKENAWKYTGVKYWVLNKEYTFFATYQEPENTNVTKENGIYKLPVSTPTVANLDIWTASAYAKTQNVSLPDEVSLVFKHLMTKINFSIGQKDGLTGYIVATKFRLEGIRGEGTYMVSYPDGELLSKWDLKNTTMSFEKEYSDGVDLSAGDVSVWDDGLLLIPQTIGSQVVKIRVDYRFCIAEDDYEEDYVEAYLPASDLWKSGKVISYSLDISDERNISFMAPTVESWSSPPTSGTIIIK